MKIAVDGRTIIRGKSGVGTYVERTMRSLLQIDQRNEYFLFLIEPLDDLVAPNLTKLDIKGYQKAVRNRYWDSILLPLFTKENSIDIFFGAAYALPLLPRWGKLIEPLPVPSKWKIPFNLGREVKFVAGILDVIGFVHPETFTPKMRLWQRIFVANAVRIADSIITISESTKRDILKLFRYDPSKIHVTPLSVDPDFHPNHDRAIVDGVRRRYALPEQFVLYVGTIEPRKNVAGIARAYAQLPVHVQQQFPLVIAGARGWYAGAIFEEISTLGISDHIREIGFVEAQDLPTLVSMAKLFVFPSLYEGFGYPPLEAMASGVPVITSSVSSLPEVVGNAGILVDPTDYGALCAEMNRVLTDEKLHVELKEKGLQRAKEFSWRKTAQMTLRVFEKTIG